MTGSAQNPAGRIFDPFTIGGKFRIVPPGHDEPPGDDQIRMQMAQGAFGSGEHETTAACLELLTGLPSPAGANILDLGCGTGILAIAALKLGAAEALCIDNDPDAIAACRHNAALNRVADRVTTHLGTLDTAPRPAQDLVLANIYGDILLSVAEQLVSRARPGAMMVVSGILPEQLFDVKTVYRQQGCNTRSTHMLGDFCALLLEKQGRGDQV